MPPALLDTNAVSDLMRDDPKMKARMGSHLDPVMMSARGWATCFHCQQAAEEEVLIRRILQAA